MYFTTELNKTELKDYKLNSIIELNLGNIAQFISFEPGETIKPRYIHINEFNKEETTSVKELIIKLINSSFSKAVNIRSFSIESMKGNELIYNKKIQDIDEILQILNDNSRKNYYTIINENIDINDGGVSGVALGNIIEFSPGDTPKCVDKEGVCILPREIGLNILEKVYGFRPEINFLPNYRVEFSLHPKRQGVNKEHTIIWEYEFYKDINYDCKISWPNNFSKFIGDKVFGLLIADSLGLRVPRTTVIARNVAPFILGKETGLFEKWIRTCPSEKNPGFHFTGDSWVDPFELMNEEERKGNKNKNIASILSQDAIDAKFSGASFIGHSINNDIIEGVYGTGDSFMLGEKGIQDLPDNVINEVRRTNNMIRSYYRYLGNVSIEWVYDGKNVWIVQLNQLKNKIIKDIIVEGNPEKYIKFDVREGLNKLRDLITEIRNKNIGIELIGNIGITSHFGDLLRQSNIPSRIIRSK